MSPILAMHMADGLLTPRVALAMIVLSGIVLAWAAWRTQRRFDPARVPLMGVLGAFVFAAQMINFPILPGTSGHLGGGLLLALLLGPNAAVLVMASILIVQCLIFQDGGLLALGANLFNLGVVPCYAGYAIHRVMAGAAPRGRRSYVAVFVAALAAVTVGAVMVPLEVRWSGLLAVPFSEFLLVMIGLHLIIAVVEAFITFGVMEYLMKVRPDAVEASGGFAPSEGRLSMKAVVASLLVVALLLAGIVSVYASTSPDALESKTSMVRANTSETVQNVEAWHHRLALLPDYQGIGGWSSAGGVIGTLLTLAVVWLTARALRAQSCSRRAVQNSLESRDTGNAPVPHSHS